MFPIFSSLTKSSTAAPEMVGLSVILDEVYENRIIISKGTVVVKPSRSPNLCGFLEICFLCKHKLLPGKDIYMYKGDKAFCSVECRYKQIFMDEEESNGCTLEYNCSSMAASSSKNGGRTTTNAFAY